jgi:glycosyltransferase involved in cell wall biosynthesis
MHICFLCSEYPPAPHGGIGTFTRTLGRALAAHGQDVTVAGLYPVERETRQIDDGVRIVRVPHTRVKSGGFFINGSRLRSALRRLHRERPIDVLEGQENSFAVLPRRFVAPKVIRMHGGHHFFSVTLGKQPRPWRSWVERRSFSRSDFRCGVSRFVVEKTCELLRMSDEGIEVLPNPIDACLFSPRPATPIAPCRIMFVGTLCEKKGVRELILAMPRVVAAVPQAELWVIGPDSHDGDGRSYAESVRSLIPPDLSSRIVFKGRVDNTALPDTMATAAVCVYPSHMEALPLAFLEGMAMGKAVVASQTGPGPEVIDHGVTGLLCDPHDPSSIAEQIVGFLQDPELARRTGAAAERAVATRFSIDGLLEPNLQWYRRCVEAYRAQSR